MVLSEWRGHSCQHRSDDFSLIQAVIRTHRPPVAVELGTDAGGFAAFLADLLREWGGEVLTVDLAATAPASVFHERPNLTFLQTSALVDPPHPVVLERIRRPGALLYCDNGHKERELALYAPLLGPDGLLGVHDYGTEVNSQWAEEFLLAYGYRQERHVDFLALANEWYPHSLTRFWIREVPVPDDPAQSIARLLAKFDEDDRRTFDWLIRLARRDRLPSLPVGGAESADSVPRGSLGGSTPLASTTSEDTQ